jgi:transcriptional regulator NrdR family protein
MVCIYCGGDTKVTNSRHNKHANKVWRRRQCLQCNAIFSTYEAADYEKSWVVKSDGGSLEPFLRDKLFVSIYNSCRHRDGSLTDSIGLADTVIKLVAQNISDGVIERRLLRAMVAQTLERFDGAAATHYNAFHKN